VILALFDGGGRWKRHIIDASSLGADGVRTADVNADGLVDLVTSWEEGGLTRCGTRSSLPFPHPAQSSSAAHQPHLARKRGGDS
jgi:hypothetical protein